MSEPDWTVRLYALNSALLFTHEIDSAFWREWELFRLPGGLEAFLGANFVLIVLVQSGFWSAALRKRSRRAWVTVLSAVGIVAAILHGAFLAAGTPQFRTVASIGLLGAWLVASLVQLVLVTRERDSALANEGVGADDRHE